MRVEGGTGSPEASEQAPARGWPGRVVLIHAPVPFHKVKMNQLPAGPGPVAGGAPCSGRPARVGTCRLPVPWRPPARLPNSLQPSWARRPRGASHPCPNSAGDRAASNLPAGSGGERGEPVCGHG